MILKLIVVAVGILLGGSAALSNTKKLGIKLLIAVTVVSILGFVVFVIE